VIVVMDRYLEGSFLLSGLGFAVKGLGLSLLGLLLTVLGLGLTLEGLVLTLGGLGLTLLGLGLPLLGFGLALLRLSLTLNGGGLLGTSVGLSFTRELGLVLRLLERCRHRVQQSLRLSDLLRVVT